MGQSKSKATHFSLLKEGDALAAAGNFQGAVDRYTSSLELNSHYFLTYYRRALALMQLKEYDDALADLKLCLDYNSASGADPAEDEAFYNDEGEASDDEDEEAVENGEDAKLQSAVPVACRARPPALPARTATRGEGGTGGGPPSAFIFLTQFAISRCFDELGDYEMSAMALARVPREQRERLKEALDKPYSINKKHSAPSLPGQGREPQSVARDEAEKRYQDWSKRWKEEGERGRNIQRFRRGERGQYVRDPVQERERQQRDEHKHRLEMFELTGGGTHNKAGIRSGAKYSPS